MRIKTALQLADEQERQCGSKPTGNLFELTCRDGKVVMLDTMPDGQPAIIVNDGVRHIRIQMDVCVVEQLVREYLTRVQG